MVEAVIGISGDINEVRKYAYLAQKITSILLKERELDRMGVQKKNRMNYIIHSLIYNEPIENSYVADSLEKYGFENDTICRCVVIADMQNMILVFYFANKLIYFLIYGFCM